MNSVEMTVVLFVVVICSFLFSFVFARLGSNKKAYKKAEADYFEKKESYKIMTSEVFDEIEDEQLTHAILFNLLNKEDAIYEAEEITETMIDVLNKEQLYVFTAYMVEKSLEGGKGSIHSFFIEDTYKMYIPYMEEAFKLFDHHEIAKLLQSAKQLSDAIDNDLDDIVIEGDYGNYNFADYTNQILSLLKSSAITTSVSSYIRKNKKSFID